MPGDEVFLRCIKTQLAPLSFHLDANQDAEGQRAQKRAESDITLVSHEKSNAYLLLRRCSTAARSTAPRATRSGVGNRPSRRPAAWQQTQCREERLKRRKECQLVYLWSGGHVEA